MPQREPLELIQAKQTLFNEAIKGDGTVPAERAAELGITTLADLIDVQRKVADFGSAGRRNLTTPLTDDQEPSRDEVLRAMTGRF